MPHAASRDAKSLANRASDVLRNTFGLQTFRDQQYEAIQAAVSGSDVFVLMPTGGGKSLCYGLPALLQAGVALIISPLIALMENQVANLRKRSIPCNFLSSARTAQDRSSILQDIKSPKPTVKLLFITPELLSTEGFLGTLKAVNANHNLSLLAVDEAHCISSWGHDFRPAYRKLGMVRQQLPGVPIMALTATATTQVQDDILKQLRMKSPVKLVSSFNRPNIHYSVKILTEGQSEPLPAIVALLKEGKRAHPEGQWPCGIIYTLKKESTEEVATALSSKGIPCKAYHAGRPAKERSQVLEDWNDGRLPLVAATIAFGMGIDRADVRLVVHYNLPKTLEAFYQESGRAGRDGQPARSLVFYGLDDRDRMDWILAKQQKGRGKKRKAPPADDSSDSAAAVAAFGQVLAYCVTQSCRRSFVLKHFGESLSSKECTGCDCCETPELVQAQLGQLETGVLQHAQQKSERFGARRHQVSRFADRSERDPFAAASHERAYASLESDSEEEGNSGGDSAAAVAAEQAVKRARLGADAASPDSVVNALARAEAQYGKQQMQDDTAKHRLQKLLNSSNSKQKLNTTRQQPQLTTAAVLPATRDNARARLMQALESNASLPLSMAQQQAGASTWESSLFQTSRSKSAYLSKLSNAVSQIKRATGLAQLDCPGIASCMEGEAHQKHPAAGAAGIAPSSATATVTADGKAATTAEAAAVGLNEPAEAVQGSAAGNSAVQRGAGNATQCTLQAGAAAQQQVASEAELQGLMQQLEEAEGKAVVHLLLQLQGLRVSQQILVETGAGKRIKTFTKSASEEVACAAKSVVKAWRASILDS